MSGLRDYANNSIRTARPRDAFQQTPSGWENPDGRSWMLASDVSIRSHPALWITLFPPYSLAGSLQIES